MIMQVKIWDPSIRGSELCATLKGHTMCLTCFDVFVIIYWSQYVLMTLLLQWSFLLL